MSSSPPPSRLSLSSFFFFNDTATTEIYTLSLHDALPICALRPEGLDDKTVVNDLATDIDGGPAHGERQLDDVDRPLHPRAKAAWASQENLGDRCLHDGPCLIGSSMTRPRAPRGTPSRDSACPCCRWSCARTGSQRRRRSSR